MKNKPTVTIGISALNEAETIVPLVRSLFKQKATAFKLQKIHIISDGSTDRTVSLLSRIQNPLLTVRAYKQRQGKAVRQNEIIKNCTSDILVLLDADITLNDATFIEKLIAPLRRKTFALTSCAITPLAPRTFFESALSVSMQLKTILFEAFKKGNNAHTCHGPARAISRTLYSKIEFTESDGEDMHSYFYCLQQGYAFRYVPSAVLHYRLPSTVSDHFKQSIRYFGMQHKLEEFFDAELISKELQIPLSVYLKSSQKIVSTILRFPLQTVIYMGVLLFVKVYRFNHPTFETWQVQSTKTAHTRL